MADERPTGVPEFKTSVGFRPNEKDKQNLRLLMASRGVTSVSDILRWCVAQQAEPVRQRWTRAAERRPEEEADG